AGKKAAKPSKEMQAALDKIDGKESIWAAGVVTDDLRKVMKADRKTAEFADKLQMVIGNLSLADEVQATLAVHVSDAEGAKKVKAQLAGLITIAKVAAQSEKSLAPLNQLLPGLQLNSTETNVSVTLKITADQIEKSMNPKGPDKDK